MLIGFLYLAAGILQISSQTITTSGHLNNQIQEADVIQFILNTTSHNNLRLSYLVEEFFVRERQLQALFPLMLSIHGDVEISYQLLGRPQVQINELIHVVVEFSVRIYQIQIVDRFPEHILYTQFQATLETTVRLVNNTNGFVISYESAKLELNQMDPQLVNIKNMNEFLPIFTQYSLTLYNQKAYRQTFTNTQFTTQQYI